MYLIYILEMIYLMDLLEMMDLIYILEMKYRATYSCCVQFYRP